MSGKGILGWRLVALVMLMAVAALAGAACDVQFGDQVVAPTQTNNQQTGGVSPAPSTAPPPPGCAAVEVVTVTLIGGGTTVRVGQTVRLDATPRDADREPVEPQCHGAHVTWSTRGTALCSLSGDTSGFGPSLTCTASGRITVTATVSSPGGTGQAEFLVQ